MTVQAERLARKQMRDAGLDVESVAWIDRAGDEFAAVVVTSEQEYLEALEILTHPDSPVKVVREYVGKHATRIYLSV